MLVRDDGLVIGQPAHAWVSGQLARAWGNGAFPPPAPREPVCLAAEQHDVGWQDADLEPLRGEHGRPLSFVGYPRVEHVAIWRDAARRLLAQSRYAALLVSLHGTALYDRYVDADRYPPDVAELIRAYLRDQRALQEELAAGLDPARGRPQPEADRGARPALARALPRPARRRSTDVPGADGPVAILVALAAVDSAAVVARDDQAVGPGMGTTAYTLAPWPFAPRRRGCRLRGAAARRGRRDRRLGGAAVRAQPGSADHPRMTRRGRPGLSPG